MNQSSYRYVSNRVRCGALVLFICMLTAGTALASPPHPDLLEAHAAAKAAGKSVTSLPNTADLHARGINTPEDCFGIYSAGKSRSDATASLGTFRVLALLVDFSDHTAQVSTSFFDTLVFGTGTGAVRHYFNEISYAQIDLVTVNLPSSIGWTRAPEAYSYYVGSNMGMGAHPNNSQGLVEDLVDLVDGSIDFSPYDNDGNGYVDVLLVVHSGTGAELSGNAADMWSHKWGITPRVTNDGVAVSAYTVQPEFWNTPGDMTVGVYAHELLHGFGLPDLYDTDSPSEEFVSSGIGRWGIMSYGSWNGGLGSSPAHPCAWSRIRLGITMPVNVTGNINGQAIPSVNGGGSIFRLWTSGVVSDEYFLVENRQKVGYDAALPNSGLLIWHIDDAKTTNREEWYPSLPGSHHMLVALEQADGLYELEHASGTGDNDDPWPGNMNRTTFNGVTGPSSDGYLTGGSFVAVENISASAPTMYADLIVGTAASVDDDPTGLPGGYALSQNYPNPFNPTTRIDFMMLNSGRARLDILNVLGETVQTLFDADVPSGPGSVEWDGTDLGGRPVASGVYFYRLTTDDFKDTRKMMLLK